MKTQFSNKKNILIYGAGEAGRQLVISLKNNPEFKVVGFIDDSLKLKKKVLLGKKIYPFSYIKKLIITKDVKLVFLAIPSLGRSRRNQIIERKLRVQLRARLRAQLRVQVRARLRAQLRAQ